MTIKAGFLIQRTFYLAASNVMELEKTAGLQENSIIFKINEEPGSGPDLVREVFFERGWIEFEPKSQKEYDWNLWWRGARFQPKDYVTLRHWQRFNHHPIPINNAITIKDGLLRHLRRLRGAHGNFCDFSPLTFHLPREERQFKEVFTSVKEAATNNSTTNNVWIYKPSSQSRGRGIFVFKELSDLSYSSKSVVQQYIAQPYLIGGYKFDLRLYAVVPSFRPLIIYICSEGLVRFSTEKYDLSSLDNVYSHLTNTSINKHGSNYHSNKFGVGPGCKWTLNALRCHFLSEGIYDRHFWGRVVTIIILTLLCQAAAVPKVANSFELYGFDILLDHTLKPWLLEVNLAPSMTQDCPIDNIVKKSMLHSLCDMMTFEREDFLRGSPVKVSEPLIPMALARRSADCGNCRTSSATHLHRRSHTPRYVSSANLIGIDESIADNDLKYEIQSNFGSSIFEKRRSLQTNSVFHESNRKGRTSVATLITCSQKDSMSNTSRRLYDTAVRCNRASLLRGHQASERKNIKNNKLHKWVQLTQPVSSINHMFIEASSSWDSAGVTRRSVSSSTLRRQYIPNDHLDSSDSSSDKESHCGEDEECQSSIVGLAQQQKRRMNNYSNKNNGDKFFGLNSRKALHAPPLQFGDFKLAFPFNEVTRAAAHTLDERKIVSELRRWLHHRLVETREKRLIPQPVGSCDVSDVWKPLAT